MVLGARRALNAVRRPGAAELDEVGGAGWVPVAIGHDEAAGRRELLGVTIQDRHDLVATGDRQRATRAEVVLDVDDQEGTVRLRMQRHRRPPASALTPQAPSPAYGRGVGGRRGCAADVPPVDTMDTLTKQVAD